MRYFILSLAVMGLTLISCSKNQQKEDTMNTTLELTQEWDMTFPKSDKVEHKKTHGIARYQYRRFPCCS